MPSGRASEAAKRAGGAAAGAARLVVGASVAGVLALVGCDTPLNPEPGPGYDFTLPVEGGLVYRWPAGAVVRVYVAGGAEPGRAALLVGAFREAGRDWEAVVGGARVRLVAVDRPEAAEVVLRWSDVPEPVDLGVCPPAVVGRAATTFCRAPDGRTLERFPLAPAAGGAASGPASGVRMVVTVLAEEATGAERVRQLVAHELGHVLGIGRHSTDPGDLMWEGPLTRVAPSPADRATVQRLYGTPADLVP